MIRWLVVYQNGVDERSALQRPPLAGSSRAARAKHPVLRVHWQRLMFNDQTLPDNFRRSQALEFSHLVGVAGVLLSFWGSNYFLKSALISAGCAIPGTLWN